MGASRADDRDIACAAAAGRSAQPAVVLGSIVLTAALAGCMVLPRSVSVWDEDCRVMRRQMVLSVEQVGTLGHCHNEGCAAALVAIGAVASVTAVVSGSVVLVSNMVSWIERQGPCPAGSPADPESVAPAGAPGSR